MYARENGKNRPRTADRALVHLAAQILLHKFPERNTDELQPDQLYWVTTETGWASERLVSFLVPDDAKPHLSFRSLGFLAPREEETGFAVATVRLSRSLVDLPPDRAAIYATVSYRPAPMGLVAQHVFGGREPGVREAKKKGKARKNPRTAAQVEVYKPELEQIRAQRQAIYESSVKSALGLPSSAPFHQSRTYHRQDLMLGLEARRALIQRMFQVGTGVQQRDARLFQGSQLPTRKAVEESWRRYQEPHHLLLNRQAYEETLGMGRKSGFFRVTQEPTARGDKFFVWPLPRSKAKPVPYETYEEADEARLIAERSNPMQGNYWWTPQKRFTARDLRDWLPPDSYWEDL